MKKFLSRCIFYVLLLLALYFGASAVVMVISKKDFAYGLTNPVSIGVAGGITMAVILYIVYLRYIKNIGKGKLEAKRDENNKLHDNSRFLNPPEMWELYGNNDNKKNPKPKSWKNIKNEIVNGMVIQSYTEKGDLKFLSATDLHSVPEAWVRTRAIT